MVAKDLMDDHVSPPLTRRPSEGGNSIVLITIEPRVIGLPIACDRAGDKRAKQGNDMNKIINGRTYTHQTQENPPRYARFLSEINNSEVPNVYAVLNERCASGNHECTVLYNQTLSRNAGTFKKQLALTPIPEQKVVAWTFETCPRDLVVRLKGCQIDEAACSFDCSLVYFRGCNLNYSYKSLMKCCDRVMPDGSLVPCGVVQ